MLATRFHVIRALLVAALLAAPIAHAQVSTPTTPTGVVANSAFHTVLASDSFSVCDDCLYIAVSAGSDTDATDFDAFSSSFATHAAWVTEVESADAGSGFLSCKIGYAIADGATTGTITSTHNSSSAHEALFIIEVASGFDTADPIRQSKPATGASGNSVTGNFDAAPLSSSVLASCLSMGGANGADAVEFSGWTELEEFDNQFFGFQAKNVQYDTSSTATTFGGSLTGGEDADEGLAAAAIEIQEPAAAGSAVPAIITTLH